MQAAARSFGEVQLATCSEELADVSSAVHDRCLLFQILRRFAENCSTSFTHAGSAGSKTGDYAGDNELVSALLYFLN